MITLNVSDTLPCLLASSFFGSPISVKCHVVYYWQTRRKQLYYVCVNWIIDAQWWITNRFWKKWCDQSLIMMLICYLYSDLWTDEFTLKFVLYRLNFEPCWWGTVINVYNVINGNCYKGVINGNWNLCILEPVQSKDCLYCVFFLCDFFFTYQLFKMCLISKYLEIFLISFYYHVVF